MITEELVYEVLCREHIRYPTISSFSPFSIYLRIVSECDYNSSLDDKYQGDVVLQIQMHCEALAIKGIIVQVPCTKEVDPQDRIYDSRYRILSPHEIAAKKCQK